MNGPQYCPLPVTRSSTSSGRPACSTSHRPCPAITVRPASRHGGWLSSDTSARKSAVRRQGQLGGAGTAADGSVPVFVASETSKVRWPSSWAPSGRVFGGSITASCRPGFPAHLTPSITLASQPIQSGRCPNLADRPGRQSITRKSLCSWPVLVQKDPRRRRGSGARTPMRAGPGRSPQRVPTAEQRSPDTGERRHPPTSGGLATACPRHRLSGCPTSCCMLNSQIWAIPRLIDIGSIIAPKADIAWWAGRWDWSR
jgi:hypothetical protein